MIALKYWKKIMEKNGEAKIMNELEDKLRIIILISAFSGIISLFFPQWYIGIYFAINESLILGSNLREIALALSMFSISLLVIIIIGLFKSLKKLRNQDLYSFWATWLIFGLLISLVPILHMIVCYNLCFNFWTFSVLGLELVFLYLSGGAAFIAGLITFCTLNSQKK